MRVLSVHAGADTGGCSWGMAGAFARADGPVELRSCVRKSNYIDYDQDADWDTEAEPLWDAADVVHFHNTTRTERFFVRAGHQSRPFVLHHHGTHYRENHRDLNREIRARKARAVVATLDLLAQGPGLPWCPAAFDLPAIEKHRKPLPGKPGVDRPLRIGHAPTNRAIKSTDAFLTAAEKLAADLPVETVVIENTSWADCLAIKGTVDVYFDQVILGYGNNAIEAWAMGIPVICGAADSTLEEMSSRFPIPFKVADESSIYAALEAMTDARFRADYSGRGKAHAKRWHDGTETVQVLTGVYTDLLG